MLHKFIQSANDGSTQEARSSLAPPKSRSHSKRYRSNPRSGVRTVSLSLGHGDDKVGMVEGEGVVFEGLVVLVDVDCVGDGVVEAGGTVIVTRPVSLLGSAAAGVGIVFSVKPWDYTERDRSLPVSLLVGDLLSPTPRPTGTPTAMTARAARAVTSQNVTLLKPHNFRSMATAQSGFWSFRVNWLWFP